MSDDWKAVKREQFDLNALNALVCHEGVGIDEKKMLRSYKKNRVNGNTVQVVYEYGKTLKSTIGRLYPQRGIGLQNFPKSIRAALAAPYYHDIDMVNSQPVILVQMCAKNGWTCDYLSEYVLNRSKNLDLLMAELDCSREDAKEMCISVMFGATYKNMPLFLEGLSKELRQISKNIASSYTDLVDQCRKAKKKDPIQSAVALVLQDEECRILQKIDAFLVYKGRTMDCYIHDGGLVRKKENEHELPPALLREIEDHIQKETSYSITLVQKPLVHTYKFDHPVKRADHVSEVDYQSRKDDFEQTYFYYIDSICYMENGRLVQVPKHTGTSAFANYNFQCTVDQNVVITEFIPLWLKDPSKRMVKRLVFIPDPAFIPSDEEFNLFSYLEGSVVSEPSGVSDDVIIERFLELNRVNTNFNDEMFAYWMGWWASLCQFPHRIPGVVLIAVNTDQGVGKDTLGEFVGRWVVGSRYYSNIKNVETELFDAHSTALQQTLFVKLEEVNGSMTRRHADQLKSIITSPTTIVNPKGRSKFTIEVYPHIYMTTNNAVPVKVEKSDRRFCISYTSSKYRGNHTFWAETAEILSNSYAGHVVYKYLSGLDISDFNVFEFPRSEYYKSLCETEVSSEEEFFTHSGEFTDERASSMHSRYVSFCHEHVLKPKSAIHFARSLAPLIERRVLSKRILAGVALYSKPALS
jgi:hypothetical protein